MNDLQLLEALQPMPARDDREVLFCELEDESYSPRLPDHLDYDYYFGDGAMN